MAKPITKIKEPILSEEEKQADRLESVVQNLADNADGITETIKLLQELHESGVLEALNSLIEAKEEVAKIAVGQLLRQPVTNAINNGMAAAGALTELDPEMTKKIINGMTRGIQKAEKELRSKQKMGVFELVKLMRDKDVNRALTFTLYLLQGIGAGLNEQSQGNN
ncbi:uncharacterized protein YjgD (DUF1641 family) [Bacillus pakistanensis]|uniref:Uncharacterized protein YjgD (DUF1641 family) n=1 Tax=Rossellomorea pakistanensis TaxID=992288 RepID=A0ABS2N7Y5_9BACI|nr:DUF1641 domain-containing protein [Bacillus pakistanensis]MBM7583970.1 uncharacterized protein YjgD (DUF1641 family) [Bacillus pakistanensis]